MIDVIVLSQIFLQYILNTRIQPNAFAPADRSHKPHGAEHADAITCWSTSRAKRLFDIAAALTGILFCAPLLFAVACLVKCTSRGPVLFRQQRAGLGQKTFTIYKFRTMIHGAEHCGPLVTRANDRRMTPIGATLRRYKLDELPQLFNVLRGDMSMVGPRPKLHQHECMQLFCRPGITGAATLAFAREEDLLSAIPEHEVESYTINVLNPTKAEMDTHYARIATLASDCRIILTTLARKTTPAPQNMQASTT